MRGAAMAACEVRHTSLLSLIGRLTGSCTNSAYQPTAIRERLEPPDATPTGRNAALDLCASAATERYVTYPIQLNPRHSKSTTRSSC